MDNVSLHATSHEALFNEKADYLASLTSPLDGMWESAFMPDGNHYIIQKNKHPVGYCIINTENYLMQFSAPALDSNAPLLQRCIDQLDIQGAFVATCEPYFLSLCMDLHKSVQVHALMYREAKDNSIEVPCTPKDYQLEQLKLADHDRAFRFGMNALAPDPNWLKSYYLALIERGELFGFWHKGELIATGECRISDTQSPYADVGMVVNKNFRNNGLASNMLLQLRRHCREKKLKAICSTERDNISAQKAIANAGFLADHRILKIVFSR